MTNLIQKIRRQFLGTLSYGFITAVPSIYEVINTIYASLKDKIYWDNLIAKIKTDASFEEQKTSKAEAILRMMQENKALWL